MSELHPISDICKDSARRDTRRADVVFVHGLMGDPFATWRHAESDETSWPHWVANAFQDVGVWSLGYPAALSKWPRWVRQFGGLFVHMQSSRTGRGHAMQLERRAVNALDRLTQKGLGNRPLIFVCHSLGGLLVKQMLHAAMMSREPREKAIAEAVSDVMFLATPHHGADLADLAKGLSTLLQATVIVDDLEAHGAHLQQLAEYYKVHAEGLGIQTHTYYEDIGILGSDVLVVNSTSANPGIGRRPVALDRDHGSICKPLERDDPVCERLREILEAIGEAGEEPTPKPIEGQIVTTPQPQPVQAPPLQVHVQVQVPVPQFALDQTPTIPCQLPQAASKFFGREDALNALVARLRTGSDTVVIGAAGMGKTALAAEALHRILGASPREGLARSPFPHGIVFVDLYLHGGMAEKAWSHIANSVRGANFDPDRPADARAADACRGRSLLLIVEGGEEADGSGEGEQRRTTRRGLIEPLHWEGSVLWLSRPMPQSPVPDINLAAPLDDDDARQLFDHLTRHAPDAIAHHQRNTLLALAQGHPLAITWACGQLARGGESPQMLIDEFRQQPTRNLKDPEDARHTLHWLFHRSLRRASADVRMTLVAAGLLANAPLPLPAFEAATGLDTPAQRAALRAAVESGLLSRSTGQDGAETWRFGHVLAYHFSRALSEHPDARSSTEAVERLAAWVHARLVDELAHARPASLLPHAVALLGKVEPPQAWWPLGHGLLYEQQDRLGDLGRSNETAAVLIAVDAWLKRLPVAMQEMPDWQRDLSVSENKLGDVLQVQGDLAGAQRRYEAGLRIREALAARDPENAGWQRDLAVSWLKLGGICEMHGDRADARSHWRRAQEILESLLQRLPDHPRFRKDLAGLEQLLVSLET